MTRVDLVLQKIKNWDYPELSLDKITYVEEMLKISFSREFTSIAKKVNFEFLSCSFFEFYNFGRQGSYSVVNETLDFRKTLGLREDCLILAQDDVSVLFMKCYGDREEIFWIAIEDAENFCEGKPLEYNPTIFPTFTDFFEFLLTKEEEERGITS